MKKIGEVFQDESTGKTFIVKENPSTDKSKLRHIFKLIDQAGDIADDMKDQTVGQKIVDDLLRVNEYITRELV